MNIYEATSEYQKAKEMLKWLEEEERKYNEWKEKEEEKAKNQ